MKKIFAFNRHHIHYKEERYYLDPSIRDFFDISPNKYRVSINKSKNGLFSFKPETIIIDRLFYQLFIEEQRIGFICQKQFDKIFFTPDSDKLYSISIKKIEE